MIPAKLVLQSGEIFEGKAPEWQTGSFFGEVVFTTGMTGYVESLTDPSYAGQILTFTYPLIGNYGVPEKSLWESHKIHAKGAIMSSLSSHFDHFEAETSLLQWLTDQKIPFLVDVDTRALTKRLRKEGVALGAICSENSTAQLSFGGDPNQTDLVAQVSCKEPRHYGSGEKRVIAVDCGMKENILRLLLKLPISLKVVPYDYDYTEEQYEGLFLSNGPGDPMQLSKTIAHLKGAMQQMRPIFGICLGVQLMALAMGAKTYKLTYGHRGQNQPCFHPETGRSFLTSQNHGYAIEEKSLPEEWRLSFRNLNDGSVEGIAHKRLPFFGVQFHPEAAPGPVDTEWLIEQFYQTL